VQILAGAFVDADIMKTDGILIMSINPRIFSPIDRFKEQVSEYLNFVKGSAKAEGVMEILIPGERSERHRQRCMKDGISVEGDLLERLMEEAVSHTIVLGSEVAHG
jgi:LDH2 family malate/lactate/ureidoglycolate dehydrogenase